VPFMVVLLKLDLGVALVDLVPVEGCSFGGRKIEVWNGKARAVAKDLDARRLEKHVNEWYLSRAE
jgi:hypothetical protein